MAGKTKPGSALKGINIKLKMINDLMDVTGSAKDSWNPAEISDDMKAIAYIHRLADTWNPAQLNEALKYIGFDTIDSWNPAIIEETKNKLVKYFLPTDASGNPIELNLKGVLPYEVKKLNIDLLPIQDLHGYDNPWVGGEGKNKCNPSNINVFNNNKYFSTDNYSTTPMVHVKASTQYVLSCRKGTPTSITADYRIYFWDSNNTLISNERANPFTTPSNCKKISFYVGYGDGDFTDGENVKAQIEEGETATAWTPYSNICPISGRNSVTLTVNGDDTEITFENTVYGGTVNVIEGGTSSTYGYIASYDGEEIPGVWISDRDAYASGTSPTTGAEVAYVLTTPTELTTSAEEVTLINGENTLSTDGDNINITYKAILNS